LIVFLSILVTATTLAGFYLGGKYSLQKSQQITSSILNDKTLEAFCTDNTCTMLGLKGTITGYDYATKTVDFLALNDSRFSVLLTDTVRVDDSYDTLYFEKNMRRGDVIYVVFNTTTSSESNLNAADIYIEKTGILAKKRIVK